MQLAGFHHLTAITADAPGNLRFYSGTLGLRLVKKTVNQDDVSAYHLFYADAVGTPGTDITFFDWPTLPEKRGSAGVVRTGFRVAREQSLHFWRDRLLAAGVRCGQVAERDNRPTLDFEDPEGQRLCLLTDDPDGPSSNPWPDSPVPTEHQLRGLGAVTISVRDLAPTERILQDLLAMHRVREYAAAASDGSTGTAAVHVFAMAGKGPAAELHVAVEPDLPRARLGAGGVHHVAFRVPTFDQYDAWAERLAGSGVRSSGPVDRFYFRSLYFREPGGTLFELATDGPGFTSDEPVDQLGRRLALPPFLEPRRAEIEAALKPLATEGA